MALITTTQPAARGEVFAPGCFDSQVGKTVPLKVPGGGASTAVIVAVKVAEDGTSVELTLNVPDAAARIAGVRVQGFSIAEGGDHA